MKYQDMTVDEYTQLQVDRRETIESLPDRCRALVAQESPSSTDDQFDSLVSRLIERCEKTGEYPERAWLDM
ncbi:MAG: hypothetical protein ACYDDR_04565 [Acidithiobacillus ferrivorans]